MCTLYRLCAAELEHSAALTGAVTAMRHDEEVRLSQRAKDTREEEKVGIHFQSNSAYRNRTSVCS